MSLLFNALFENTIYIKAIDLKLIALEISYENVLIVVTGKRLQLILWCLAFVIYYASDQTS